MSYTPLRESLKSHCCLSLSLYAGSFSGDVEPTWSPKQNRRRLTDFDKEVSWEALDIEGKKVTKGSALFPRI